MEGSDLKYYCIHGILWSSLATVLSIGLIFLIVSLMLIGSLIGLGLGFIVLFITFGALNSWIDREVWNEDTDNDLKAYLAHGFVLFFVLLIVGLPSTIMNWLFPGILTMVVMFVLFIPVYGYAAKMVAGNFEKGPITGSSYPGAVVNEQDDDVDFGDYYSRH